MLDARVQYCDRGRAWGKNVPEATLRTLARGADRFNAVHIVAARSECRYWTSSFRERR
jgi:hypothetical protein